MGPLAIGTVVLVPFPFSDLTQAKLRPALVLASAGREDWILCQITSNPYSDPKAIYLSKLDFKSGTLDRDSYVRPGKLFTAHQSLIVRSVGQVDTVKMSEIRASLLQLLS